MADRQQRVLRLVMGSLAASTRRAYTQAWQEFLDSGARRRSIEEGLWQRTEDVVQFILSLIDRRQSRVTITGKLAGIAFMGKLFWGYPPSAGEIGRRMLEGWARELGNGGRMRRPLVWGLLKKVVWSLSTVCEDKMETELFTTLMLWMFFGAFRVSELLGSKSTEGLNWKEVELGEEGVTVWLRQAKTDQRAGGGECVWQNTRIHYSAL